MRKPLYWVLRVARAYGQAPAWAMSLGPGELALLMELERVLDEEARACSA